MDFPNLVPVVVVTILNIFLGMLWYSPLLLGSRWAKSHKFESKKLKPSAYHYIGSILVSFITALIIAVLIDEFQVTCPLSGLLLGFCLWLGFIATTHFSGVIWAQKPLTVYFIDVAYLLISVVMMSTLLTLWL